MGEFHLRDQHGAIQNFRIKGNVPDEAELGRIADVLAGKPLAAASVVKPDSLASKFGKSVLRGVDEAQAGVFGTLEAGAHALGSKDWQNTFKGMADEQLRQRDTIPISEDTSFGQELASSAGSSVPLIGAGLAGGVAGATAGAAAGSVVPIIGTAIGGVAGAALGAGLATAPIMMGSNLERQRQEHPGQEVDYGKAALATGGQAIIEGGTEALGLKVAGIIGRPLMGALKTAFDGGVETGTKLLAKRAGGAMAVGIPSGAVEESTQQFLERWQADLPLLDEQAQAEYIKSAVIGGILEGGFNATVGVVGGVKDIKQRNAFNQAKEDADAEAARLNSNAQASNLKDEAALQAELKATPAGQIEDRTNEHLTEQLPDQIPLANDHDPLSDQSILSTITGLHKTNDLFTEDEYNQSLEAMKEHKSFAPDKLKLRGMGRPKANAIFSAMRDRGDAQPTGSNDQYLTIKGKPKRSYITAPIQDSEATPFRVHTAGRRLGGSYKTAEEATNFATTHGIKTFEVTQDKDAVRFGLYETYEHDGKVVGKRLLKAFHSSGEANSAARELDPKFSEETNFKNKQLHEQLARESLTQKAVKELGNTQTLMQQYADNVVGKGRVKVNVVPKVDAEHLRSLGIPEELIPKGQLNEGVTIKAPDMKGTVKAIISLGANLSNPNLSEEARTQAIHDVLNHELVHALRNLDILTKQEWDNLFKHALTQKVPGKKYTHMQLAVARQAPGTGSNMLAEEGIAEMLRLYQKDPTAFSKPQRSILQKINDFLRKIIGLSKRYGANETIDAIFGGKVAARDEGHGGLGGRAYPGNPAFASVKVPGFYMKSDTFFTSVPQEKGNVQQWLGLLRNSGIKKEELDWLGIEDWMRNLAAEKAKVSNEEAKLTKGEILDYIRANGVDLMEEERSTIKPEITQEQDYEFRQADLDYGQRRAAMQKRFAHDDNYNHYVTEWEFHYEPVEQDGRPRADSAMQLWARELHGDDEAEGLFAAREKYERLKAEQDAPALYHEGSTQAGGDSYHTLVLHLPGLKPEFSISSHFGGFKNIIASIRFKTRMMNGKKTLKIEEIQGDIHQHAAAKIDKNDPNSPKVGYRQEGDEELAAKTYQAYLDADEALNVAENEISYLDKSVTDNWELAKGDPDLADMYKKIANDRMVELKARRETLGPLMAERKKLQEYAYQLEERVKIPDAPFKTTWSDLAFKRIVRYAVDNGYDQIAWHGEPASVADTENYGPLIEKTQPDGSTKYFVGRAEWQGEGPSKEVTGIINFYTTRLRQYVSKAFAPFNTGPVFQPAQGSEEEVSFDELFPSYADFNQALNAMFDKASGPDKVAMRMDLRRSLQIARNQRVFNPKKALNEAGVNKVKFFELFDQTFPEFAGVSRETFDANGNPNYDQWVMPISEELKASKDAEPYFPLFSGVREDPKYSMAAPMGQRVPQSPPQDVLTRVEQQITYDNLAPFWNRLSRFMPNTWAYNYRDVVQSGVINLQDRMQPWGKLIDRMRANGGFITNENDVYLREQLFHGQTDAALQDADRRFYDQLARAVKNLHVTSADAREAARITGTGADSTAKSIMANYSNPKKALSELYVYAKHARERNAKMRLRNKDLHEQLVAAGADPLNDRSEQYEHGSGMPDDQATAILNWFISKPFHQEMENVSAWVQKIVQHTNDVRVAGKLNPDFRTMVKPDGTPVDDYKFYVPLRSWIDEHMDEDDDVAAFARAGKGFNIRGKEDFAATGRASLGANILENVILQNQEAIIRANKNIVGLSVRDLIAQNPQAFTGIAEIVQGKPRKPAYNRKNGKVRMAPDNSFDKDEMVLKVKDLGQPVFIKFKDARLAKAVGSRSQLGNAGGGAILRGLLNFNRFLANVNTSYNPEFLVSNMLKDLTDALVNIGEFDVAGAKRQVLRDVFPALAGVWKGLRTGDMSSEWAQTFDEFKKYGGMTAFMGIHELSTNIDKMHKNLAEDMSGAPTKVWKALKSFGKFIEDSNSTIENGTRLATYKTLRDAFLASGDQSDPAHVKRSKERAAAISKNLTINFNMGGEWKPILNGLYLFYNAGLQGSMAVINPFIRSRKMKAIWGGILMAGLMQDLLMGMLSAEDDDGKKAYDKIEEWRLEHNLIYMDPFGLTERGYFQLPLPYMLGAIYNAGRSISRAARGAYTPGEAANSTFGTLADSLNPLGGANSVLNWVAPTIADPIVDLAQNENFMNLQITPPQNPYTATPEKASQRYWANTSPIWTTVADFASWASGSEGDFLPGAVEFSPNQYEYVVNYFAGGAGGFVNRAADLFLKDKLDAKDIPFVRRVYGNVTTKNDETEYYHHRDAVLPVLAELKAAHKNGDSEQYTRIMQKYPEEYKLAVKLSKFDNARKKLSAKIKKVREAPDNRIAPAEKKKMIDGFKAKQDELVGQANSLFN